MMGKACRLECRLLDPWAHPRCVGKTVMTASIFVPMWGKSPLRGEDYCFENDISKNEGKSPLCGEINSGVCP